MNATRMFWPSASSPSSVEYESPLTWPSATRSPPPAPGRRLPQGPWWARRQGGGGARGWVGRAPRPLHVRAHQGAVGVVVLEEGDERRRDRDDLLRRDVHEVRVHRGLFVVLVAAVDLHALLGEVALVVELRVGLDDRRELLLVGGQVHDLFGDAGAAALLAEAAGRRRD